MKMRQFKRSKLATMCFALFGPRGPIGQWLTARTGLFMPPAEVHPMIEEFLTPVAVNAVEGSQYIVRRAKDAEIVLETNDINEATALMEKHHRQKKAKLLVFRGDGEPVLFVDGVPA